MAIDETEKKQAWLAMASATISASKLPLKRLTDGQHEALINNACDIAEDMVGQFEDAFDPDREEEEEDDEEDDDEEEEEEEPVVRRTVRTRR